jgi:hypothetical protein
MFEEHNSRYEAYVGQKKPDDAYERDLSEATLYAEWSDEDGTLRQVRGSRIEN